jgi:hypothetical protein
MDAAVGSLAHILRFMPWVEELIDAQLMLSFLNYCFREDSKID